MKIGRILFCLILLLSACTSEPVPQTDQPSQPVKTSQSEQPTSEFNIFIPSIRSGSAGSGGAEEATATMVPPDPHIEIRANQTILKVGETLTVTGVPVEIGIPYYYLNVRDEGVQDDVPLARVTYANEVTRMDGSSAVLEFISAEGGLEQVVFVLRAIGTGVATVTIIATGEIHGMYPAPAIWNGSGSGDISIVVK